MFNYSSQSLPRQEVHKNNTFLITKNCSPMIVPVDSTLLNSVFIGHVMWCHPISCHFQFSSKWWTHSFYNLSCHCWVLIMSIVALPHIEQTFVNTCWLSPSAGKNSFTDCCFKCTLNSTIWQWNIWDCVIADASNPSGQVWPISNTYPEFKMQPRSPAIVGWFKSWNSTLYFMCKWIIWIWSCRRILRVCDAVFRESKH